MLVAYCVIPRLIGFRWVTNLPSLSPANCNTFQKSYKTTLGNEEYLRCCKILEIPPGSDQNQVREAFLKQVKKYHPDSISPDANDKKFREIEEAYRKLLDKFALERWKMDEGAGEYGLYYQEKKETVEFDIRHTAPQHRQYLSYDGIGSGTPREREKQYQKFRAATAVQNVYKHRVSKLPVGEESAVLFKDKVHVKKNKSSSELHRLVEDLIQESMAKGDFENLPGAGKPLPAKGNNPYVDFVTHKINEVLIESGFTPEWISLQKEIKDMKHVLREALEEKRACLGPEPLTTKEVHEWERILKNFRPQVEKLNKKINDFNLQVPILDKQMIHFALEREAQQILKNGRTKLDTPSKHTDVPTNEQQAPETLFTMLNRIFWN